MILFKKALLAFFMIITCMFIVLHHSDISEPVTDDLQYHFMVPPYTSFLVISVIIIISFLIKMIIKNLKLTIPSGAIMVLIGYLWGIIMYHNRVIRLATQIVHISPFKLIYIFIPTVLFNLSFCLDVPIFLKTLPQIVVIGIPVCLLTSVIFGGMTRFVINSSWSISAGMWFGVFCLPIYPKKLTAVLKQQSFRTRQIGVLLEGEALFSFMVVDILYLIFYGIMTGYIEQWYQYVCVILRFIILGFVMGYLFGLLGRYLLRKMYNSKLSIFTVCCTLPYLTHTLSDAFISSAGDISVVVLGLMLGKERTILTKETEHFLLEFWELAGHILDAFVCSIYAIMTACYVTPYITFSDYALILGTYLLYFFVRFISFLIFSPIISRLGYGMDLKNMIICVWGSLKSPYGILVISLLNEAKFDNEREIAKFYIIGLYMFSNLFHGGLIGKVLNFLELNKISTARQINMFTCMKLVSSKKDRAIAWLKQDRFLADTNWQLIKEATNIKNPYMEQLDEEESENVTPGYRYMYCSECMKEVTLEPTANELKKMVREAKMKVLKAKKMSYSRQHENGMISKEGIRILTQAVDLGMDSEATEIKVEDLYRRFTEEKWYQRLMRKRLEALHRKKEKLRPPRTYWRRKCYHIVVQKCFNKIMLAIITLHCCILGFDYYLHPSVLSKQSITHKVEIDSVLAFMKMFFALMYTFECIIKILAFSRRYIFADGCYTYFRSLWNLQDFILVITSWCSFERSLTHFLKKLNGNPLNTKLFYQEFVEVCELLRVLRLLRVFSIFYRNILQYLDKMAESRMAFTYELGKSYANGEAEVLEMLHHIIIYDKIRDDIRKKMETDRVTVTKLLGVVQKERPWIAITVKTRQAIRTILNGMNEAINTLKSAGWVDTHEYDLLLVSMNDLYKKVNAIKKVQPSPPKVIFKEVTWMANDEDVIDFLFENVTARSFEPGEIVFDEGHVANGIYILVTGLFMISYTPNPHILRSQKEYGLLPIVDYHSGISYDEPCVDYIVSGNCIGEHSVLTLRAFNCTIKADAHSQAYVLSYGILRRAMQLSPDQATGLECRIWKEVGVRIALPLLNSIPAYQSYSQEQIKGVLERAFVPDLSRYKIFAVTEVIEDVVVIEGLVADINTKTKYIAPCCIPRTVQKLVLPNSSLINIPIDIVAKLLIIPVKDMDEFDVMELAEETCELANTRESSKCLHHTIQDRIKNRKRRKLNNILRNNASKRSLQSVHNRYGKKKHSIASYAKSGKSDTESAYITGSDVTETVSGTSLQITNKSSTPSKMFIG